MRWLIACALFVTSPFAAYAQGPIYAELQLGAAGIEHADRDFYPPLASISAGFYLRPGIGLEIFADAGLGPDEKNGVELEIDRAYGIALRLESAPIRRVQGYFTLGAVSYSINQQASATDTTANSQIDGDFNGVRISVGLVERLKHWDNVLISAEYRHYNADDPLSVDALLLGIRINTP